MKNCLALFFLLVLSILIACKKDEVQPSNHIKVKIDGKSYTFVGGGIYEPLNLLKDTVVNTIYIGGFIGTCSEGSHQFIDIQLNQTSPGSYEVSDGIQFWMETQEYAFFVNQSSEEKSLRLVIDDIGTNTDRVSGTFVGENSQYTITGEFSLPRLPDHSVTLEVAQQLCQ